MTAIELEIHWQGQWQKVATVEFPEANKSNGIKSKCRFDYDFDFVKRHAEFLNSRKPPAVSLNEPLNFGGKNADAWFPFLLDIVPQGAARRFWLQHLGLTDGPSADIELLARGAINPPGQLRVKPMPTKRNKSHPGFAKSDIFRRDMDFISYAAQEGALVEGGSGAPGESPKFMLVRDHNQRWHADGAIADELVESFWLVKFPRSKNTRDVQILEAEAPYYAIARELGLRAHGPVEWESNALFIPRFDRHKTKTGWQRLGFETLNSALGVSEFGVDRNHEDYLMVIAEFSDQLEDDIFEYIYRDLVNIAMGNTDNHGRNTAFLKTAEQVSLSPLFDFAPMSFDEEGIARVSKWRRESYSIPDFAYFKKVLHSLELDGGAIKNFLRQSLDRLQNVPQLFRRYKINAELATHATKKYDDLMGSLTQAVRST